MWSQVWGKTKINIFLIVFSGEAVPIENTWSGVHIPVSRHKSYTTSIVQKSPPSQSITNFTDQTLHRFCGGQNHHNFDQQFLLYGVYSIFWSSFCLDCSHYDLSFFSRGLGRSGLHPRMQWRHSSFLSGDLTDDLHPFRSFRPNTHSI